ncbi:transketolase family protein [Patescibacteria group bacterium]
MRESFFNGLYEVMKKDERVILLSSDTGFGVMSHIREEFPDRWYNVGIAEQNMIGMAAGLALCGKIVYVYAICPFVTLRCIEQIRVDVCIQNLNVNMVGVGAGYDYGTLGATHHACEDIASMRLMPNMTILNASDSVSAQSFAELSYDTPGPVYVRFERYAGDDLYDKKQAFLGGLSTLKSGDGGTVIISGGKLVHKALEVAENLLEHQIGATVIDLYRIKPLNVELLLRILCRVKNVVTIEEHSIVGGLGSSIAELIVDTGLECSVKRIALPDAFLREYGDRECLHELVGLDVKTMTSQILVWLRNIHGEDV